jgi:hypothetical protein
MISAGFSLIIDAVVKVKGIFDIYFPFFANEMRLLGHLCDIVVMPLGHHGATHG